MLLTHRRPPVGPRPTSLDRNVRAYPIAALFLRDALQRLGTAFIAGDGQQAMHLLTVIMAFPDDADLLRPYFTPAAAPGTFIASYKQARPRSTDDAPVCERHPGRLNARCPNGRPPEARACAGL